MRGEFTNQRLPGGLGNVAGDGAFVAVGAQVISRLMRVSALVVLQKRRAPGAGVVTGAGALNLDDVGAQIGQGLGAPGAGEDAGKVENANAVK